jgi:hypothetical protein
MSLQPRNQIIAPHSMNSGTCSTCIGRVRPGGGFVATNEKLLQDAQELGHVEWPFAFDARVEQCGKEILLWMMTALLKLNGKVVLELNFASHTFDLTFRRQGSKARAHVVGPALEAVHVPHRNPQDLGNYFHR